MPCTWVNWVCAISHAPTCSVGVINKMDELLQDFQSSVSVTFDLNDPNRPHPRLSEFKFKREGYGDQESRRRKLIEEQKSRRRDYVDYARMIAEGDIDLCSDEDEMEEGGECIAKKQNKRLQGFQKLPNNYDIIIMTS